MKIIALVLLVGALVACNSCVPQPAPSPSPSPPGPVPTVIVDAAPPPVTDAAPGPTPDIDPGVRDACANLAALHCAEGMAGCDVVMQKALVQRLTVVPLDCLVGAHSKSDVHACGKFVACP